MSPLRFPASAEGFALSFRLLLLADTHYDLGDPGHAEVDALLAQADTLFAALPATAETDDLLDARRLALLPPHAVLINVGRGNAVDEEALAKALAQGALHAAFLDVMKEEPYPDDGPLRRAPRCYLLPHASAFSPDYLDRAFAEWLEIYRRDYRDRA